MRLCVCAYVRKSRALCIVHCAWFSVHSRKYYTGKGHPYDALCTVHDALILYNHCPTLRFKGKISARAILFSPTMGDTMPMKIDENFSAAEKKEKRDLIKKLDAVGWSLFFIWMGIVLLMKLKTPAVITGIGLIILVKQGVRKLYSLEIESFWAVVGMLFIGGGVWDLTEMNAPFGAIVLIGIGAITLYNALAKKKPKKTRKEETPAVDEIEEQEVEE